MNARVLVVVVSLAVLLAASPALAGFIDHFATSSDIGPDKAPHLGPSSVLVLPVVVDEAGLPAESDLLAVAAPFYDNAASGFTFRSYYRTASLGRYDPQVTVGPAIHFATCPFSVVGGTCTIVRGDASALIPAVKAIWAILDQADPLVDFATFDINGVSGAPDNDIDGIVLLVNIDFGGIALPHWRICQNPLLRAAACVDTSTHSVWDPTYDGVLVPWVAVAGAQGGWVDGAVHVSVHEFGHLLGFADLYDERGATTDLPYSVMGGWTYDDLPTLPDAFSREVIGWGNAVQVGAGGVAFLRPAITSGDLLKLGTGDEYFLAEYRTNASPYDGSLGADGVVVYHVDLKKRPSPDSFSFLTTITSCVNCNAWEPMLMVEQADGRYDLQLGPSQRDDRGDLFLEGDTFPGGAAHGALSASNHPFDSNRYDGTPTGVAITSVDLHTESGAAVLVVTQPLVEPNGGPSGGDAGKSAASGGQRDEGCAAVAPDALSFAAAVAWLAGRRRKDRGHRVQVVSSKSAC